MRNRLATLLAATLIAAGTPDDARAQASSETPGPASSFSLGGMLSGSTLIRFDESFRPIFNIRAIPELKLSLPAGRRLTFDGELSVSARVDFALASDSSDHWTVDLVPYRAWLRLSTSRFEARLGLQKLSFGSATLFRPLMWFDSLDPRDPLQLTDGVYGLLLRYFFAGNANIRAWGLYGNEDRRGFDLAPPDDRTPEFGGRVEIPLFKIGEIGATYHHRKAEVGALTPLISLSSASPALASLALVSRSAPVPPASGRHPAALPASGFSPAAASPLPVPEDRFGLDGKLDLGVGVWFEGTLVHQHFPLSPLSYQRALTLGLDYTFALGRGLTAIAEHFRVASSARAFSAGHGFSFSALLLRYPVGLLDQLSGIFYYDWESRDVYRFLSWTRTTDELTFSAIVFWNPTELLVYAGRPGSTSFAGTGLELLLAYHF